MPAFIVQCRTSEVAPDQFVSVVTAVPAGSGSDATIEAESRYLRTRAEAQEACAEMAVSMRKRLERRGDSVVQVDFA